MRGAKGQAPRRLLWVALLVGTIVAAGPASAEEALSKKWKASLEDKSGEHGWLGKWIIDDSCSKNGLAGCGHLSDVLGGKLASWPQDYFADSLKVAMGQGRNSGAQSAVCIAAFGCDLIDLTLEILAASGKPEAGRLLLPWLADEAHWKGGAMGSWRGLYVRVLGWWGDKAQAGLVTAMASHIDNDIPGNPSVVAAAAWLLSTWGDKSLLPTCKRIWKDEIKGDGLDDAKRACAFYAIGQGDLSDREAIASFDGTSTLNLVLRVLVGDKSQLASWKSEAAPLAKQPDNGRAIVYAAGMAALGDKGANGLLQKGLKSCKPEVVRETMKMVTLLGSTRFGAEGRKSVAGCLGKFGDKDIEGRALAQASYALLRAGDASAMASMSKVLASSDGDVLDEASDLLVGNWGSLGVHGHSKGLAGGVPVKGLGKAIAVALGKDLGNGTRKNLEIAWAMQRAHGAD